MIQDQLIDIETWCNAFLYYRGEHHQKLGIVKLYAHIFELPGGPLILSRHAEWFEEYRNRDKLVKSFMHPEGE